MYSDIVDNIYLSLRSDSAFDGIKITAEYPSGKINTAYPCVVVSGSNQALFPAGMGRVVYSSSDICYMGNSHTADITVSVIGGAEMGAAYIADLADAVINNLANNTQNMIITSITAGKLTYDSKSSTLSQSVAAKYLKIIQSGEANVE